MRKRFTLLLTCCIAAATEAIAGDTLMVEHFDSAAAFSKFIAVDGNSDGTTWRWNQYDQSAVCYGVSANGSDDWLLTPEMNLKGGRVYRVSYKAYGSGVDYTETLSAAWGSGTSPDNYTVIQPKVIVDNNEGDFQNFMLPSSNGSYRMGFHAMSDPAQYGINIDDIVIDDIADSKAPAAPGALRATAATDGTTQVTLIFRTPFRTAEGGSLSAITKVEIRRNGELITTFNAPRVNQSLSYTDSSAANGQNTYEVTAYNDAGQGIPATIVIDAGEDIPGSVSDVKLQYEGEKMVLSWKAPAKGANGGYFNSESCKYNVYYAGQYSAGDLYMKEVSDTTVTIDGNDGEQRIEGFYVSAVNNSGEGEKTESNELLLGKPYQMPVTQDFGSSFSDNFKYYYDNWTDNDNHIWWREYSSESSRATYNSNGYISFILDGYDDASFNTGKIAFADAVNPQLTFLYKPYRNSDRLTVSAQRPDNTQVDLFAIANVDASGTNWTQYTVDLSSLKGLSYAVIKFTGSTDDSDGGPNIDEIHIIDATEHNLNATIETPKRVVAGLEYKAQVLVNNFGTTTASGYTVNLFANGKSVASTVVSGNLEPLTADTVRLSFTPQPGLDLLKLYATVDYEADENIADNTTATVSVDVTQPDMETVADLKAEKDGTVNKLTWTAIEPNKEEVTDDMESYPAFTLPGDGHYLEYEYNIGPWYNYDADKEYSLDIPGYSYPWEEEAFAFITFNPDSVKADADTVTAAGAMPIWEAHSGKQFLTAFSMNEDMAMGAQVNDWLISPRLSGDQQTVTFWFKTLNIMNGTVSFKVAYSTTDSLYDSFTHVVADSVTALTDWTPVSIELPAGAKYFAINHLTPVGINQMLMIDDITYTTGTGTVLEYHVYRDGEYIATVSEPQFTDSEGGDHSYNVTAVYNSGESGMSNTAKTSTDTGISALSTETTDNAPAYNLSGQRVGSDYKGVIIVKGKKYIRK